MDEIETTLASSYEEIKLILMSRVLPMMSSKHGTSSTFFLSVRQMDADDLLNDAIVKFLSTVDRTIEYRDVKKFVVSSVLNICKQLLYNTVNKAKQAFKRQEDIKEAYRQQRSQSFDGIKQFELEDTLEELNDIQRTIVRNIEEPDYRIRKTYNTHYRNVKAEQQKTFKRLDELGVCEWD